MFKDRVVLVTGGGKGMGRDIALAFGAQGARVALCGRTEATLEKTAEDIRDAGGAALFAVCDVAVNDQARAAVKRVVDAYGHIDILVNNAGMGGMTPIDGDDDATWREIVDTNVIGTMQMTRAAVRHIPNGGRILNTSSVLGRFGVPGYSAYCASKHAIVGLTRALAHELAERGITVNAIAPGWVDTQMAQDGMVQIAASIGVTRDAFYEMAMSQVPLRRMLAPEEIADLVLFLASERGRGITGACLDINGGSFMG